MLYWGGNSPCSRHSMWNHFFFLSEDIKHIQLPKPLPSSLAEHSSALSHITAMSARPRPPAPLEPLGTEPRGAATAQNYPECSASRESHGWQLEHPPRPLGRRFARSPRHSPTTHECCSAEPWFVMDTFDLWQTPSLHFPWPQPRSKRTARNFILRERSTALALAAQRPREPGSAAPAPPVPPPPMWFQLRTSSNATASIPTVQSRNLGRKS